MSVSSAALAHHQPWLARLRTIMVLRPGQRVVNVPGIGVSVSRRAVSSGAGNWWEAGGASGAVAVYQPKGAASLAASYVNLANPGTYDAAPGTAPTHAAATGWTFAAASSQWLTTGYTVSAESTTTALIRFSDLGAQVGENPQTLFASSTFSMHPRWWGSVRYVCGSVGGTSAGEITSGVFAIAPSGLYQNGSVRVSFTASNAAANNVLTVGKDAFGRYLTANVLAFAVYEAALSAAIISAISAAMAAL